MPRLFYAGRIGAGSLSELRSNYDIVTPALDAGGEGVFL